jgi:hypothetical protein
MTRKERVIAAVNHKATDYIPSNIFFTQQEYEKMSVIIRILIILKR